MALLEFSTDMYREEIFYAQFLIDQKIRPKSQPRGLRRLFKSKDDSKERYLDYFKMFNKTSMDLYNIRVMREDDMFYHAILLPMYEFIEKRGVRNLDVNDYNGTIKAWHNTFKELNLSDRELEDYLEKFRTAADTVPSYNAGIERDMSYLERPLREANELGMSYADFKKTENFAEILRDMEESEDFDESFDEWEKNQYANRFRYDFQKRVVGMATDKKYVARNVVRYYDDILESYVILDRTEYKNYIRKHGSSDEKKEVAELTKMESVMQKRIHRIEQYFLDKASIYYHKLTPASVKIPPNYTGMFLLVYLRANPESNKPVARSYTYVNGQLVKEELYTRRELDSIYTGTLRDLPVIVVENGSADKRYRYVPHPDNPTFKEQMDRYWDVRYIIENAEEFTQE